MKIHFIAIGGSAMHNLAIALHRKGDQVTGSDDGIFEPSRSRLEKEGILPTETGWFPEKISKDLDCVILGMHAHENNPELQKVIALGIPIFSYPEFLWQQFQKHKRMVVAGSHGKTTITAAVLHVLNEMNREEAYMVGAKLEGYDCMVNLNTNANWAVLEGDEYLTSPLDKRSKFLWYKPHVAIITGIAWDHFNVFPTFEDYLQSFRDFIQTIEPEGTLVYYEGDETLKNLVEEADRDDLYLMPYNEPEYKVERGQYIMSTDGQKFPLEITGKHNMQNLLGASFLCHAMEIDTLEFWHAISSFEGASGRMDLLRDDEIITVYKDFGHAPSKVEATIQAAKEQYPKRKLLACIELHTYSSLNKDFLPQYKGTTKHADEVWVYYNPKVVELKKLPEVSEKNIKTSFDRENIRVFTKSETLKQEIQSRKISNTTLLFLSSGNFDGINLQGLANLL